MAAEVGEGVEGDIERGHALAGLAKQQPALEGRQRGPSQGCRVGVGAQKPVFPHGCQAGAEGVLPAREAGHEGMPGGLVAVGELAGQRADRAPSGTAAEALQLDDQIPTGLPCVPGVQP